MKENPQQLRIICQRPLSEENVFTRNIRKVSIYITRALVHTPISPNQITIWGIIVFLIGSSLVALGNSYLSFLGAAIMWFSFVLCAVDGEVARYKKLTSWLGIYYEIIGHIIRRMAFFIGVSLNLFSYYQNNLFLILGLCCTIFLPPYYLYGEDFVFLNRLKAGDCGEIIGKEDFINKSRLITFCKKGYEAIFINVNVIAAVYVLLLITILDSIFTNIFYFRFIDIVFFFYCAVMPLTQSVQIFSTRNKKKIDVNYSNFIKEVKDKESIPRWKI